MISTHKLDFELRPYNQQMIKNKTYLEFRIGCIEGLYTCHNKCYEILALKSSNKGSGHMIDVLEWFEASCKRDKCSLKICEIMNKRLYEYLVKKGFQKNGKRDLIKSF